MSAVAQDAPVAALRGLLGELSDLKRIRVAGRTGSLAEQLFARAWGALAAGAAPRDVALHETARAVAATRLAGVDADVLRDGGLGDDDALAVLRAAFDEAARDVLDHAQAAELRAALAAPPAPGTPPAFAARLAAQPRAGATAPGRARVMVEPPESHADHCAIVAVGAVLLAPGTGADAGRAFTGALAHHLHNAWLPDAGFAGELLLGDRLGPLMTRFTERALAELDAPAADAVRDALGLNEHLDGPEARAVVAADVLDRVLQMRHHARVAGFTLEQALGELGLVHEGPLQAYGLAVVEAAGLR